MHACMVGSLVNRTVQARPGVAGRHLQQQPIHLAVIHGELRGHLRVPLPRSADDHLRLYGGQAAVQPLQVARKCLRNAPQQGQREASVMHADASAENVPCPVSPHCTLTSNELGCSGKQTWILCWSCHGTDHHRYEGAAAPQCPRRCWWPQL